MNNGIGGPNWDASCTPVTGSASAPFYYNTINSVTGLYQPSSTHVQDSYMTGFFRKYLFQKLIAVYKWTAPETWDMSYFQYVLFGIGYIAIVNTEKLGVIPQMCTLGGQNVFYRPSTAYIQNPLLGSETYKLKIGIQTELIKVQPDYCSVMDIVNHYAGLMSLSIQTLVANTRNSQLSYVGFASHKAEAETLKKMFDNVLSGEPAVVIDKGMKDRNDGEKPWDLFTQNVGQNYIAKEILEVVRQMTNMFLTEIGVENANLEKKERMITAEVQANNEETATMADMWLEQMKEACAKARKMFPSINIDVDWRVKPVIVDGEESED